MNKIKTGMAQAVTEHLLTGKPITHLEAVTLFGVSYVHRIVSDLRKEGWVVKTQRVTYAKALRRVNEHASLVPPRDLPIKEILFTEYWISR
jgi:hypothetical protein